MPQQIRFYRGASGVSLPGYSDGSVFIISSDKVKDGMYVGDMYVDAENGQRLHIAPNDAIYYKTTAEWENYSNEKSVRGRVYVISDYISRVENNKTIYIPGVKVGDGKAYIGDLPIYQAGVTSSEKEFWNNKVTAFMLLDENNQETETLVLSKN